MMIDWEYKAETNISICTHTAVRGRMREAVQQSSHVLRHVVHNFLQLSARKLSAHNVLFRSLLSEKYQRGFLKIGLPGNKCTLSENYSQFCVYI